MKISRLAFASSILVMASLGVAQVRHTFTFGGRNGGDFILDGKIFQIRAGEIDPGRVPEQYWRHRIQMAKAMGLNTIAPYIFWNDHERVEGKFDFKTERRNIGQFLKICQQEGMWVFMRPGPYVCGEWDGGGLPSYLWKYPDTKFRSNDDKRYTDAVARYIREFAKVLKPHMIENGGHVIMVQVENEYGSYPRHDRAHMTWLRDQWIKAGINGPFSTCDGPAEYNLKDSSIQGAAVGLDSGLSEADWSLARRINPGVPVFSGETYPGWLRHWGEGNWEPTNISKELRFYMDTNKSFNVFLVHGGTNFGFNTGANHGGKGYEPDLTSYDYGSPINEQGNPTKEYHQYRAIIADALQGREVIPEIPKPIPTMTIGPIQMRGLTNLWSQPVRFEESQVPKTFEEMGQNQGLVIYRTTLPKGTKGKLSFEKVSDYAIVLVEGKYLGSLDRRLGQREIEIPEGGDSRTLDICVEGMGRINFSAAMDTDRKGIFGVKFDGKELSNWTIGKLPLTDSWVSKLSSTSVDIGNRGIFVRGEFKLSNLADTYLDMRQYKKGVVWVNGHNLGRFWSVGPQFRLYCPAPWLKKGQNVITVLDLEGTEAKPIEGFKEP